MPRNDDWMSTVNYSWRPPQLEWYGRESYETVGPDSAPRRIFVDKTAYKIRYEQETESSVVLVIEPKEGA